jgi:hypothetical protein
MHSTRPGSLAFLHRLDACLACNGKGRAPLWTQLAMVAGLAALTGAALMLAAYPALRAAGLVQ